jgi:hypothetical protein
VGRCGLAGVGGIWGGIGAGGIGAGAAGMTVAGLSVVEGGNGGIAVRWAADLVMRLGGGSSSSSLLLLL